MRTLKLHPRALHIVAGLLLVGLAAAPLYAQGAGGEVQGMLMVLLIPAVVLVKASMQSVIAALFPHWTARARTAILERRALCLGWGALLAFLTLIVVLIAGAASDLWPPIGIVGLLPLFVVVMLANWGAVGMSSAMGESFVSSGAPDSDRTPFQTFVGALVLGLACLLPILGQVLILLLLFAALGAGLMALFTRSEPRKAGGTPAAPDPP